MREEVISSGGTADPTAAASSVGPSSPSRVPNGKSASIGSAFDSSRPSCRPWEKGDLLRRLGTFKPSHWSAKPKAASSLACAQRGWINVDVDKITCEFCGACFSLAVANDEGEAFEKKLDETHKSNCPWKGKICPDSLVQFPPAPPSALIAGFKDRCDVLMQFDVLPLVSSSAIEEIKVSRAAPLERLLNDSQDSDSMRDCTYTRAQKIISLCGWEPRWLPNIQDCEEHSARDGCSFGPARAHANLSSDAGPSTKAHSASTKNENGRKLDSRSPLLDCILCGSSIRVLHFLTVPRPPTPTDAPETSKKLRGGSAASGVGVSGWIANDDLEIENIETTSERKDIPIDVDLNLTIAGGFSFTQDVLNVQPTASFESHNPSRKRGSPQLDEGTVVDQKRPRADSSGAGPSRVASRISSSVMAMDTVSRSDDESMESVENVPGDIDEASTYLENDVSELNNSAQAVGEASTNVGRVSGGSVGMSASRGMSGESGAVEPCRSVERGDSNWKEMESVESGEKGSRYDVDPSLSCNARLLGCGDEKDLALPAKSSSINHVPFDDSEVAAANNIVKGESNYEEEVATFDPIGQHSQFCPWVNGNVAAAGNAGPNSDTEAHSGWQLTLDAIDTVRSLGEEPVQIVQSESAASLYKDDHRPPAHKVVRKHSLNKSHGHH